MLNPKLITIFLILFVSALLGYFGALPKLREGSEVKQALTQAQSHLAVTREDLQHVRSLIDFYDKLPKDDKNRVLQALPSEVDLPNLLVQIDRIARESGVLLDDFSIKEEGPQIVGFNAENEKTGPDASRMTMKIAGGYTATKQFLQSLEVFLRVIDIDSILITPFEDKSATATLQMIITARTYKSGDKIQALNP